MTAGRCAGCGSTDPSCKKVRAHVMNCPDFAALYRASPEKALDPEAEYVRWTSCDRRAEVVAAREKAIATAEARRAAQAARFRLSDTEEDR